jgi:hypothetical protein
MLSSDPVKVKSSSDLQHQYLSTCRGSLNNPTTDTYLIIGALKIKQSNIPSVLGAKSIHT